MPNNLFVFCLQSAQSDIRSGSHSRRALDQTLLSPQPFFDESWAVSGSPS